MKTTKGLLVFLFLAMLILATGGRALAQRGYETTGATVFDEWVNPKASGQALHGTLAIHYEFVCVANPFDPLNNCACKAAGDFGVNMYFVFRTKDGQDFVAFSGQSQNAVCFLTDLTGQRDVIEGFFADQVIPSLFPNNPTAPFALRSVAKVAESTAEPFFLILDMELAVAVPKHHCKKGH